MPAVEQIAASGSAVGSRGVRAPFPIPESVVVRGERWRVVRRRRDLKAWADRGERRFLRGVDGATYFSDREIFVKAKLSRSAAAATLLHELLHACGPRRTPSRVEERLVRKVEWALLEALGQLRWRRANRRRA